MHYFLLQASTEILGAKDGSSEIDDLENEKSEHDNLVDHPYSRNTTIGVATQHNGIYSTQHHNEQSFYKNRGGKFGKPLF